MNRQKPSASEPGMHFTRNRVVVIVASLLAMLVAAALAWLVMATLPQKVDAALMLPVKEVTFTGAMQFVDATELKRVAGGIRGGMLRTDLNDVKAVFGQVHWVRNVDVRRRFPSTLEVSVEEHRPFARWAKLTASATAADAANDSEPGSLVNTFGEVFEADLDQTLPVFSGPTGASKEVLANYVAFTAQLAAIGRTATEIKLSARRAWQLRLDNGAVLELGRSEAGQRLARYVRAYPTVPALQLADARVDMRYQSGMAVKFAADATPKITKKTTTKS